MTYWTITNSYQVGMLFPAPILTLVGPDTYELVSSYPDITYLDRPVVVEVLTPGGPVVIFTGTESQLATPQTITFSGLEFTEVRALYTVDECQYNSNGGVIIPPTDSCGVIVVNVNRVLDCDTFEFMLTVEVASATGFPVGDIVVSVDGIQQAPQSVTVGVPFVLGPYPDGSSVDFVIENTADAECNYVSETYTGNVNPEHTVDYGADLFDILYSLPGPLYLITSDNTNIIGTDPEYAGLAIGDVVGVDGVYNYTPNVGDVMFAETQGEYFIITAAGVVQPYYPPVVLTQITTYPGWTVVSSVPSIHTGIETVAIVEVFDGTDWIISWVGPEENLATAQPVNIAFAPQDVRVNYYRHDCPAVADGAIVTLADSGPHTIDVVCGEGLQTLYIAPIYFAPADPFETLDIIIHFVGQPGSDMVIESLNVDPPGGGLAVAVYDNTSDTEPPPAVLNTTYIPAWAGFGMYNGFPTTDGTITVKLTVQSSLGGDAFVSPVAIGYRCDFNSTPVDPQLTNAVGVADCDNFNWNVSGFGSSIDFSGFFYYKYTVNGGAEIFGPPVEDFTEFTIGPFQFGDVVIVTFIPDPNGPNPNGNTFTLLPITNSGTSCPITDNPCVDSGSIFRADQVGDASELPVAPADQFVFVVISDTGGLGTYAPGQILVYEAGLPGWTNGGMVPDGIPVSDDTTIYQINGGNPYNVYAAPVLGPALPPGSGNYYAWLPDINTYGITTNRAVALQVYDGTSWSQVWAGNEQDLADPTLVTFPNPWQQYRFVYNWEGCPIYVTGLIGPPTEPEAPAS